MAQFWFNVRTGQVEADDARSKGEDLMGPYPSHEAAARALATARERTEAWDEQDRRWRDGDDADNADNAGDA
jgi:hypothetical protein